MTIGPPRSSKSGLIGSDRGREAAKAEVDVFLTGEMNHGIYHEAKELDVNVIYGGHYATETAGLKALAEHLSTRFRLETFFLDLPTGA